MTSWTDLGFYVAGVACLAAMAGLSLWAMLDALIPNWPRILAALFPQAASDASPRASALPRPTVDEADAGLPLAFEDAA